MIDLNNYSKEFDGIKYVPFDKAVEALNELAKLYSTQKLDDAIKTLSNELSSVKPDLSKFND